MAAVDTENHEVKNYILAGKRVWGAAISENEKELIVTNGNSDDVTVIDTTRMVAIKSIPVGRTPHSIKILK